MRSRLRQNLKGKVFGRLTVVELSERQVGKHTKWKCICTCGTIIIAGIGNLNNGNTKSCGCSRIRKFRKDFSKIVYPNTTHNRSGISYKEYISIHDWLKVHYGKPKYCEHCNEDAKAYQWALRNGCKYERDINNFIRLCRSCHFKYDVAERKRKKEDSICH